MSLPNLGEYDRLRANISATVQQNERRAERILERVKEMRQVLQRLRSGTQWRDAEDADLKIDRVYAIRRVLTCNPRFEFFPIMASWTKDGWMTCSGDAIAPTMMVAIEVLAPAKKLGREKPKTRKRKSKTPTFLARKVAK